MRRIGDAPLVRRLLIGAALLLSALFLLLPLVAIFAQAFSQGVAVFWANVSNTFTLHAIGLTLVIALMTIPICLVFGVALAWLVTRFSFPGRRSQTHPRRCNPDRAAQGAAVAYWFAHEWPLRQPRPRQIHP
ncbi:MAG: hypothetical protein VYB92_04975, partial [Pseudomonadota bacterium]|nr:hypothetical protein [Pseudomonadota bacterium]